MSSSETLYAVAGGTGYADSTVGSASYTIDSGSGPGVYYYIDDMLGSSRTIVKDGQTSACYEADFYPFGGERDINVSCVQNYKFEGKERDGETQNDNFGARYYSSRFGRWLSPDWSASPEPVPYAALGNPQSLNLYGYVGNNPASITDPTGHCWKWAERLCNYWNYGVFYTNAELASTIATDRQWLLRNFVSGGGFTNKDVTGLTGRQVWVLYNNAQFQIANGSAAQENAVASAAAGLLYPISNLQHEFSHAPDFGVNGSWDSKTGAQFQKALEDIVNGANTKEYDIEFRGQAGFKAYLDQPTGKAVIFDTNGNFAAAWNLGREQVQGVVVNGKLW